MSNQELPSTRLQRRALILRSAFLSFQAAKGHLETELAEVEALDPDHLLRSDSVERLRGLFREQDYVEPNILSAIRKLCYPEGQE